MGKWISINDRLPKMGKLVICGNIADDWVVAGQIGYDRNWYNQFEDPTSYSAIHPTHWRPMPSFQGPTENSVASYKEFAAQEATAQDKIATNRTVEEALNLVVALLPNEDDQYCLAINHALEEIEKLRR